MSCQLNDTICAIATPLGEGGVGIVRVSGEKAIDAALSSTGAPGFEQALRAALRELMR